MSWHEYGKFILPVVLMNETPYNYIKIVICRKYNGVIILFYFQCQMLPRQLYIKFKLTPTKTSTLRACALQFREQRWRNPQSSTSRGVLYATLDIDSVDAIFIVSVFLSPAKRRYYNISCTCTILYLHNSLT